MNDIRRLSRRDWIRWAAAWSSAGLAGCGGDDDSEPAASPAPAPGPAPAPAPSGPIAGGSAPGSGTAGTSLSAAQRIQTFDALQLRLTDLYDASTGRLDAAAALQWLSQQSVFQRVGFSATRDVYAIFTDGRPLLIASNSRTDAAGVGAAPPPTEPRRERGARRVQASTRAVPAQLADTYEAGIPSSQMRFMSTWFAYDLDLPAPGTWARNGTASFGDFVFLVELLKSLGYRNQLLTTDYDDPRLTVEGLKDVRGDGVFFWITHGGMLDPAGQIIQGLMTVTDATQEAVEQTYADEFAEGTLIYCTGPLCVHPSLCGRTTHYTRLAITPQWIRKYRWSFDPYSVVFVDACASALAPLKQACLDAGASLYLGWTKPVRIWAMIGAAVDFYSLMLGVNENAGGGYAETYLAPRQRPYDWGAVMDLMHARAPGPARYDDAEDGLVELEPTLNRSIPLGFLGLRPSIYDMAFDETRSELTLIGGMFGNRSGSAAIGTALDCPFFHCAQFLYGNSTDWKLTDPVPLTVLDWKSENVVLRVPREGPGSAGLVQVSVDSRFSNAAQLTRVTVPISATKTFGGSLCVSVTAQARFRADFRGRRLEPVQDPTYTPVVPVSSSPLASGSFTASGTYSWTDGDTTTTVDWSGGGSVGPITPEQSTVLVAGTVELPSRATRLLMTLIGVGIVETTTVTTPNRPPQVATRTIGFSIASRADAIGDSRTIEPSFDQKFEAAPVTQTHAGTGLYPRADATTSLSCGPFTAEFPPLDDKGGR